MRAKKRMPKLSIAFLMGLVLTNFIGLSYVNVLRKPRTFSL